MNPVLETLFLPAKPAPGAAFLNARYHGALSKDMYLQQHFRPWADELQARGLKVSPDLKESEVSEVFVLLPKNMAEARAFIARGLQMLKNGGKITCAAANDAGGARLKKMLEQFGLQDIEQLSKNHARVAWGVKGNISEDVLQGALEEGAMQNILAGAFQSMPGLFAWDKIDKGSEILIRHLPDKLKGRGADFGCGYGLLARHVLGLGIEHLTCIDADVRAVEACRINLKNHTNVEYVWADLTKPFPQKFDWIVMNPPFHEGKGTSAAIGQAFIKTASLSLKPGGHLWMVGNVSLPYEEVLQTVFAGSSKKFEGQGFKVIFAEK